MKFGVGKKKIGLDKFRILYKCVGQFLVQMNWYFEKNSKFIKNVKFGVWKKENWVGQFRISYKWVGQFLVQMIFNRPKRHWNSSISGL